MNLKDLKTIVKHNDIKPNDNSLTESDQDEISQEEPKVDQSFRFKIKTNEITASFAIKLSLPDFSSVNINMGATFDVNEEDIGIEKFCDVASQCMYEVKRAVVEEVKKLGLGKRVETIFTKEYKKI